MMKSFFKASVATVVSAVMVIGMSSCGRSESGADSDSDAVKTNQFKQGHRRPDYLGHGQRG